MPPAAPVTIATRWVSAIATSSLVARGAILPRIYEKSGGMVLRGRKGEMRPLKQVPSRGLCPLETRMNPASLVIDVPASSRETQRSGRTPMLKTIRKFVRERSRDVHRRRRPISEDDDTREPSDASEAPQQSAEQQLDEPPAPTVWGKVRW